MLLIDSFASNNQYSSKKKIESILLLKVLVSHRATLVQTQGVLIQRSLADGVRWLKTQVHLFFSLSTSAAALRRMKILLSTELRRSLRSVSN